MEANRAMPITFSGIAAFVLLDLGIYVLLPEGEGWGVLAQRIPRITWAALTCISAALANSLPTPPPYLVLFLSLLMGASAATDLLLWVPYYAMTAEFEKCKGIFNRVCKPHVPIDRFTFLTFCLVTGVFYTLATIHTAGVFTFMRDEEGERRMRRSFRTA